MLESRKTNRKIEQNLICTINTNDSTPSITRKVLNISLGGMLLEKINRNDGNYVYKHVTFNLLNDKEILLSIKGIIIREQERSLAIKFEDITKEQLTMLKVLCI